MSPFFVVFCNIVGTLDEGDYSLLKRITDILSRFRQSSRLGRLVNLLQSLQRLCEPLFEGQSGNDQAAGGTSTHIGPPPLTVPTNEHPFTPNSTEIHPFSAPLGDDTAAGNQPLNVESGQASSADWMMWELFNSQIPAGWLNSDFDPFTT